MRPLLASLACVCLTALPAVCFSATVPENVGTVIKTDTLAITLDNGSVTAITDARTGKNYLAARSWLLTIVVDGKEAYPTGMKWSKPDRQILLEYPGDVRAEVAVVTKPTHMTFELLSVTPQEKVEMVVWGPFATTISQNVGNLVGILWDSEFALGLQSLNPKTLGGIPGRTEIARAEPFGGSLSASCRDQQRPTQVKLYDYAYTVAFRGEGVAGSKIALFGCPTGKTLDTISAIELAENLPHVTLNGEWVNSLPGTPYLAFEFDEKSIDQFIKVAKDAGIPFIYHPSPWETWGHFEPKKSQFPSGRAGFKACVDKAHRAGLRVGAHTLSTFITADDAYVTPKPDPRLATAGASKLTKDVTGKDNVLEVADATPFGNANGKKCIRVGDELITFGNAVGDKPARLVACSRGAFGTTPQPHRAGDEVARLILIDFAGPIFLGNRELNREIAQRGAKNCLEFGLDKYEFDGLEGTRSSGLEYSMAEFAQAWYDALGPKRGKVMLGGSALDNYLNHIMDCVNWGEPWGDVFRKSMLDYRFMRLEQYRRNLLPHMLGQYSAQVYATAGPVQPGQDRCRVEDIEWLMALRAGHDAGFSLTFTPNWDAYLRGKQTSPVEALLLPNITDITAAMHAWETAYRARAFSPDVQKLLGDPKREFHLVENGPASWTLYPIHVTAGPVDAKIRTLHTENPYDDAPFTFVISNGASPASHIALKLPGNPTAVLTGVDLKSGEIIKYTGGNEATIYNYNWAKQRTVKIVPNPLTLTKGPADIRVEWGGAADSKLQVEARLVGPAWKLTPGVISQ